MHNIYIYTLVQHIWDNGGYNGSSMSTLKVIAIHDELGMYFHVNSGGVPRCWLKLENYVEAKDQSF